MPTLIVQPNTGGALIVTVPESVPAKPYSELLLNADGQEVASQRGTLAASANAHVDAPRC